MYENEPTQFGGILTGINQLEPQILESKISDKKGFYGALIIGTILVLVALLILNSFEMSYDKYILLGASLVVIYAIILFFMVKEKVVHEVREKEIHHYERPVIKEVIREVEKPVFKTVIEEIIKPVIIEAPQPILEEDVPKKYIASKQTKRYHLYTCRLAKLIKPEYKIEEDDKSWMKRRGYEACKVCKP